MFQISSLKPLVCKTVINSVYLSADILSRNLTTYPHLCDWIRRNTPRKPRRFKLNNPLTLLKAEQVRLEIPHQSHDHESLSVTQHVSSVINTTIAENASRYFAVVYLAGKQFKVTTEDLIMVKSPLYGTEVGDEIRLEKVLLLGARDFTLIGRPILPTSQVEVKAMLIEKTLEHPHLWFQFHRRRRHRKMRVFQDNVAVLRITKIQPYARDLTT